MHPQNARSAEENRRPSFFAFAFTTQSPASPRTRILEQARAHQEFVVGIHVSALVAAHQVVQRRQQVEGFRPHLLADQCWAQAGGEAEGPQVVDGRVVGMLLRVGLSLLLLLLLVYPPAAVLAAHAVEGEDVFVDLGP